MNRLPVLLAVLGSCIWPASLDAVLTFTFSPDHATGSTILTLSGRSQSTSLGFIIYDQDGLWDFFENDGKPLNLDNYFYGPLTITIWGYEPFMPENPLTIGDRSGVSPTGSDQLSLGYSFDFEKGALLQGSGTYPMEDLLFSKFHPGSGVAKNPVGAPFAVVVEDDREPISPVPEPTTRTPGIAVAFVGLTIWGG